MATQTATEVLIDGRLYDVSGWRHPGGTILKFYQGSGDASVSFKEFHQKSPKALKVLKALPSRSAPSTEPADPKNAERLRKLDTDYVALREELIREGWFEPNYFHAIYRITELVVMHALGVHLLLFSNLTIPALLLLGIAQGRCGWAMHEGGHFSLFSNTRLDIRLQEFLYGVGCGMSAGWWRSQHNRHHATPQKLQHDVDLDTMPLVAFHRAVIGKGINNPFVRMWIPFQAYFFGPITCSLVAHFWQIFLHPRFMWRKRLWMEFFWLAVRYTTIYSIWKYSNVTWQHGLACYMLYIAAGGSYIFTNFALSHTHLPVVKHDEHRHWVEYAAEHTINITPHFFTNWWMGYLNFQIEHHLFPTMPQYKFIALSPRIRKFFQDHGLKYDVRDYFSAMSDTFANLNSVGKAVGEVRL